MARAYLGLGSNQGDRVALVNAALERLEASGRVRVIKRSSFYETAPVGVTDQPRFVNLVAEVHRSEEHTSELQSHHDLVCRLLLEKKKQKYEFEEAIEE